MSTQNVFLLWTTPLFYESISRLLKHPNIELVGAASNYAAATSDILNKKPNTILIEDMGNHQSNMINDYLELYPWVVKLIFLGLKNNELIVYHHEQRSMAQTEDLLKLILSELR